MKTSTAKVSFHRISLGSGKGKSLLAALLSCVVIACAETATDPKELSSEPKPSEGKIRKVEKTDEEWKKTLTPEQYRILRKAGTERPNGEVYDEFKKQGAGTYFCLLYTSDAADDP